MIAKQYIIMEDELLEFEEEMFLTGHDDLMKKIVSNVRSRSYDPDALKVESLDTLNQFGYEVMHLLGNDDRAVLIIKTWLEKKTIEIRTQNTKGDLKQ